MLRSTKLFAALICVTILFGGLLIHQSEAGGPGGPIVTYEIGPLVVYGYGDTSTESRQDAYGELYDAVSDIEASLPSGHSVWDIIVENEGWISPGEYMIEFVVVVVVNTPPPGM